ncbi:hypothetical protein QBC38DRAFT_465745 [Podospora fimiseda]|uniref:Transcription factor domain-containing protein n=1 Tax=Podospora fimiseda TaxID=252190 RepID=A0AAN7BXH4_9PEZI|nr:hypothetical protein QBC38DRAFT_465745 [Podospora fimiseda]
MTETLPSVFSQGFGASSATTVALLVFALGEAAHAGFDGRPIHMVEGHASGMRGGGAHLPPGLVWFNEARRRMGFQYTEVKLENVQIFALAGAYYGSCFCPAGFWKSTRAASQACQDLIDSDPKILSGPHATLLRRVFWHCSIMETCLNLELGFPLPNLQRFEEVITQEQDLGTEDGHMLLHFYSQIALRRVLVDFHNKLSQKAGPSVSSLPDRIRECAAELEIWRGLVPVRFAWEERSPVVLPNSIILPRMSTPPSPLINMPSSPGITRQQQPQSMFSIELDDAPERYPNAIDVQIALLRSRYFYTKYLIYRPFIYKALHYPDLMSHTDVVGAIECLRATLKWPVAMSPTCKHKRLIPCMFFFTQSFFGILIIYHLTRTVPALRKIRSLCGDEFEIELNETIGLYLDWVRDLKEIDIGTRFHWDVIKALYGING